MFLRKIKINYTKSENAFTLIEALVALSISSLAFVLLSMSIGHFKYVKNNMSQDRQLDWHLFVNQMEYYMNESELVQVSSDRLVVNEVDSRTKVKMRAEYLKVNQNFIRRVNNGTQPMVMNIRSVSFKNEGQSLLMTGNFNNGEQYQARIWIDSWYANETS